MLAMVMEKPQLDSVPAEVPSYGSGVVSETEGEKMNSKYLFPAILIGLQLGAGVVCFIQKDIRMAMYWFAASVVNACAVLG